MKAAFIVMSILGCDDAGAKCTPLAELPEQWQTIAACDAASDSRLSRYADTSYPVVIAVCQTAGTTALADSTEEAAHLAVTGSLAQPAYPGDGRGRTSITTRALQLVRSALPSGDRVRDTVSYPLHVVTDTYSWVARKIAD